jgi:integrase
MGKSNTSRRVPKYRRQARPDSPDDAFVELDGDRIYLGEYGSAESRAEYARTIAEYEANGRHRPIAAIELIVIELIARYRRHVDDYYRKPDGSETKSVDRVRQCMKPVKKLYGHTPAASFGPNAMRAVRQTWIDAGRARRTINHYTQEVRRMFKWAASHELLPASTYQALATLDGLRRGRSKAKETAPVKPVPEAHINAVKKHLREPVVSMVELQLLTGMRPGELVIMRGCDLDTSGKVWSYTPAHHKTEHLGHERAIYLGPKAQAIIERFLQADVSAYLFDPRQAITERAAEAESHRRKDQMPNRRKTHRTIGDRYTVDSYRRAVERACAAADVPRWTPHQLRHNAASRLRREYGIDLAQTILGHRLGSAITEIYAEANVEKARDVMAKIG